MIKFLDEAPMLTYEGESNHVEPPGNFFESQPSVFFIYR